MKKLFGILRLLCDSIRWEKNLLADHRIIKAVTPSEKNERDRYERFSDRLRKCNEDGTLFREKCPRCGQELLMCKKYVGQCNSGKCREERIN